MSVMRVWLAGLLVLSSCGGGGPDRAHVDALFGLHASRLSASQGTGAEVELGRWLFEHGLNGTSCASCHTKAQLGQDGRGHPRNTPALLDVSRQLVFGWDGREAELAAFVRRELQRDAISSDADVQRAVDASPELRMRFAAACADEAPTLARCVAALTAELQTWRSRGRWDRYVEGDDGALSALEREGVQAFVEVGCAACHGGRDLGGRSLHKLGLAHPYECDDVGRQALTGRASDRQVFKAPMLRHAANTGPYLHDGSIAELADVVRLMGHHELGVDLQAGQVRAIVALLHATAETDSPENP